ncbi:MAG: hypothetical protein ACFBSD_05530 [Paracoccaceae bacterium]
MRNRMTGLAAMAALLASPAAAGVAITLGEPIFTDPVTQDFSSFSTGPLADPLAALRPLGITSFEILTFDGVSEDRYDENDIGFVINQTNDVPGLASVGGVTNIVDTGSPGVAGDGPIIDSVGFIFHFLQPIDRIVLDLGDPGLFRDDTDPSDIKPLDDFVLSFFRDDMLLDELTIDGNVSGGGASGTETLIDSRGVIGLTSALPFDEVRILALASGDPSKDPFFLPFAIDGLTVERVIPLPGALPLLLSGLGALALFRRRA